MITTTPYDENLLFSRIAGGDEPAFRQLFDLYRERLFAFAWQICHSSVDAEEVVQDVFMKLWEQRSRLGEISYPRQYIYTMARNRTLDLLAKIARNDHLMRQVWIRMKHSENDTEQLLNADESKRLIQTALSQLSEKKQAVFTLSRDEGLSHQDIAARLGISVQTVKNIMTETLRHIQHFLAQHSELLSIIFWLETAFLIF